MAVLRSFAAWRARRRDRETPSRIGKLLAHDAESYRYLIESIRRFPDMPTFEAMIGDAETWAILDGLAAKVVGSIVARYPTETGPVPSPVE